MKFLLASTAGEVFFVFVFLFFFKKTSMPPRISNGAILSEKGSVKQTTDLVLKNRYEPSFSIDTKKRTSSFSFDITMSFQ